MTIPQTDPRASYLEHRREIDGAIAEVLQGGRYILGEQVSRFEADFAAFCGVRHAVGVANGTDAVELSLRAAGVALGQTVFTVSHTAVATVVGIERAGGIPLLIDIDPSTYTMHAGMLEDAIRACGASGRRPAAIVAVHLYGMPADMHAIMQIASRHQLQVIEDCAQAHGATFRGRPVGSLGNVAAFSFYPTKNLGAIGDGGAVCTNDDAIARQLRALREYGWEDRYVSAQPGLNSRLDEIQAAILRAKLSHLSRDNARRCTIARQYDAALAASPMSPPAVAPETEHVFHQYVVRSANRDAFRSFFSQRNIATGIHYPIPIHLQPAYASRIDIGPGGLKNTERAASEVVSLPMFPQLIEAQVKCVTEALQEWAIR